ncbi:DUF4240 domain-containing protein [Actinoplanes sp. NPDC051411]|uniref:DUF4240 domain-containing protein n=1 Tax=Actinoplanes sp. NPDC051411 TaxID=3155522 RepID=UPI003448A54E
MEFWDLIDAARAEAAHMAEWPSGMQVGDAVARRLPGLQPVQILEFDLWLRGQAAMADHWELGAACYLFSGYVSEDGFAEFRFGLVALGRADFHRVLAEPDAGLAALPVVQAIAAGHASPFTVHAERLQSAASDTYGDRYWEDRADLPILHPAPHFTRADVPLIPTRLPGLHALFPKRAVL